MSRRKTISDKTKLAAALRELGGIAYEHAKGMSAHQVVRLFHWDHGIPHSLGGPDEHWNLTPRLIAEHREKTAKIDVPQVAKTKRIEQEHSAYRARMLKKSGQSHHSVEPTQKPKRRWPSRPFPKTKRVSAS